jgi:uridine phosphorylase
MTYHPNFTEGSIAQHTPAKEDSITSPSKFIRSLNRKMPKGFYTEYVIFCYSGQLFNHFIKAADRNWFNRPITTSINIGENNSNKITLVKKDDEWGNFALCHPQVGASNVAILAEELYAAGFENFLSIGPAGHIYEEHPSLQIGDFVIAEEALPYESTSAQYTPENAKKYYEFVRNLDGLRVHDQFMKLFESGAGYCGLDICRKKVATTGALYRETSDFAKEVLSRGVEVLDMETSGFYAALKDKEDARFAAVFYISDLVNSGLHKRKWQFPKSRESYLDHRETVRLCLEGLLLNKKSYFERYDPNHKHSFRA